MPMAMALGPLPRLKKLAVAAAVAAFVLRLLRKKWLSRPRNVPIAPGHWLLGNLIEFARAVAKKEQLNLSVEHHRRLGPTLAITFPLAPWVVVTSSPKNLEHILKTNFENYPKGELSCYRIADLLGNGIFAVDGQKWLHQRKIASKMFTASLFKEHIWAVVRRNARKLRDILEAAGPGEQVDIFNLMNRFTLDTIGEIGFGKSIGSLEDPESPFLKSFDRAQQIAYTRFFTPGWQLLRWLGIGSERETAEHFGRLDSYSRSVVRELLASMTRDAGGVAWADIEARKSFVGLFVEDAQKRGEPLSEDFLRDLVLNFLIAGRDTTAQALSWTIYLLCAHPEVEARARQEVCDVCGVRGPAYEDMGRLPYLQAVLSEAMRLYPSVPQDVKEAACDDTLPDGTFVTAGTLLVYDIYSMGRDAAIWGEDAEAFRPERWLEMSEVPSSYTYPVFNAGPRECLGKRLAMVEMKTCLATLLPQVSFKLAVPAAEIIPDSQLTIGMGRGLPCFVVRSAEKEARPRASSASSVVSTAAESEGAAPLSEASRDRGDSTVDVGDEM